MSTAGTLVTPLASAQENSSNRSGFHIGFPLESKWETSINYDAANIGGYIGNSVYVGLVGFGAGNGRLAALDINSGEEKWSMELPNLVGTPIADRGSLFIRAGNKVFSVNPNNGSKIWESRFSQGQGRFLSVQDDQIFGVSTRAEQRENADGSRTISGELVSFDRKTGNRNWEVEGEPVSGMAVGENNVFVTFSEDVYNEFLIESAGSIHAYTKSGEYLWNTDEFSPFGYPVPTDSVLVGVGRGGTLYGFGYSSGRKQWERNITSNIPRSIEGDEILYLGDSSGQITAFSVENQSVLWQRQFDRTIRWLSQYDGVIYLGIPGGNVQAVDRKSGETIWTYSLPTESAPITTVRQDEAFFAGAMDPIYCFAGQRAIAQEKINETERTVAASVIGSVSATFGQESYISRAKNAFRNKQYQRAQDFAVKAENQAENGLVLAMVGALGGVIGGLKKVKKRTRKRSIRQDYNDAIERADDLQQAVDFDIKTEPHIRRANPSNYDSLDEAREAVNDFENYLTKITEVTQQRREIIERRVLLSGQEYSVVDEAVTRVTEILRQDGSINEAQMKLEKSSLIIEGHKIKNTLRDRLSDLEKGISSVDIATLEQTIERVDHTKDPSKAVSELKSYHSTIDKIERVQDLADWDLSLPLNPVVTDINRVINHKPVDEDTIEEKISDYEHIRELSENIVDFIEQVGEDHPDIDIAGTLDDLDKAISDGDLSLAKELDSRITRISEATWVMSDLFEYDWEEFEHLISKLWNDMGYSTTVTQASSDRGIDVIAKNNGENVLIQVKQNSTGNKVGRPTIQKTAGALSGDNADRAVVVTASSYTNTAVEEAERHNGKIRLISGDQLLNLLNTSRLAPPESDRELPVNDTSESFAKGTVSNIFTDGHVFKVAIETDLATDGVFYLSDIEADLQTDETVVLRYEGTDPTASDITQVIPADQFND